MRGMEKQWEEAPMCKSGLNFVSVLTVPLEQKRVLKGGDVSWGTGC